MTKHLRKGTALTVLVAMLTGAACLMIVSVATANPPGIPDNYKKVFQFNVIGYPEGQSYDGNCGNGHRIFVNRNTNNAKVRVSEEGYWAIADCDATKDKTAMLYTDMPATLHVYARLLGKPGGKLKICYGLISDYEAGEDLCEIAVFDLGTRGRGKSTFSIAPRDMFDEDLEDIMWIGHTNADFRIAQFRVYREE
jgi:hypothetical protein